MGPSPYKGIGGGPAIRRLQTDGQFGSLDDLAPLHMSSISTEQTISVLVSVLFDYLTNIR